MNKYQLDTVIQLTGTFYNVALNQLADPTMVVVIIEDPQGNVTVNDSGVGHPSLGVYTFDFVPSGPGIWLYKWQGTGLVIATSKDTRFVVQKSYVADYLLAA